MQGRQVTTAKPPTPRSGALTVEVALIMPVFVLFLMAIMEFGHYCLVVHTLNAAARRGAHLGSFEGVSSSDVVLRVKQIVNAAINADFATVQVLDGSIFDSADFTPSNINYNTLPAKNLLTAARGDTFIVRVRVPYDDVSLLPPFWIKNKHITGLAAMRHE